MGQKTQGDSILDPPRRLAPPPRAPFCLGLGYERLALPMEEQRGLKVV